MAPDDELAVLLDELIHSEPLEDWHPLLPGRLSATQVAMAERCPEQYRRTYVLGQRQRPGGAMIMGAADHSAHALNFHQKISSGEDLPVTDVQDAFADAYEAKIDEEGGLEEIDWKDKPGEVKDRGAKLVGLYHEIVSPLLQPRSVEAKLVIDFPSVPVPVLGYADVVLSDSILERKTSASAEYKPKPQWRPQALTYQAAAELPLDWHISYAYATPKTGREVVGVSTPAQFPALHLPLYQGTATLIERMYAVTARKLLAFMEFFGPDEAWPGATTHTWACHFCGFQPDCDWWKFGEPEWGDSIPF